MRAGHIVAVVALVCGAVNAVLLRAQAPQKVLSPVTNSIGMAFIRIEPGSMQVGVFHPDCTNGARAGAVPAAGRANASAAGGAAAPVASGPTPGVIGAGPAVPTAARGARGGARDARMNWDEADIAACEKLAATDRSDGVSVTIRKPFLIGTTEVTQGQWKSVMNANPSMFTIERVSNPDRHPVENVTWGDAQRFVRALNAKEKTTAYRLPTELEWEYACRAGGLGQQTWAEIRAQAVLGLGLPGRGGGGRQAEAPLGQAARAGVPVPAAPAGAVETLGEYTARTGMTNEVATKAPNAWGVYDMLGNVWEWTADYYNGKMFPDPAPPRTGTQHVLKGGAFTSDVKNAICATHDSGPADGFDVGLRIVRGVN